MKKFALAFAAAALVVSAGSALAATTDHGTVSYTDPASGLVRLTDGTHYQISQPVLLNGVAPGDHVVVTVFNNKEIGFRSDDRYYSDHDSQSN